MVLDQKNPVKMADFAELLAWYGEMGVEEATFDEAMDWSLEEKTIDQAWLKPKRTARSFINEPKPAPYQERKAQSPQTLGQEHRAKPPQTPPGQDRGPTTLNEAQSLAKSASTLSELKAALETFNGCALKRTAKNLVFYRGAETAKIMIIGEAPGRDEDIVGKPFVGRAGQLLDRMLKAINLDPGETHITNIVYWRPPGNRTPTPEEASLCRPFIDRQIELVQPELILFLGGVAAKQMYQTTEGITKMRGKWRKIPGGHHQMETMATLHPAYLLRTPIAKRLAWQDLQLIAKRLKEQ